MLVPKGEKLIVRKKGQKCGYLEKKNFPFFFIRKQFVSQKKKDWEVIPEKSLRWIKGEKSQVCFVYHLYWVWNVNFYGLSFNKCPNVQININVYKVRTHTNWNLNRFSSCLKCKCTANSWTKAIHYNLSCCCVNIHAKGRLFRRDKRLSFTITSLQGAKYTFKRSFTFCTDHPVWKVFCARVRPLQIINDI